MCLFICRYKYDLDIYILNKRNTNEMIKITENIKSKDLTKHISYLNRHWFILCAIVMTRAQYIVTV